LALLFYGVLLFRALYKDPTLTHLIIMLWLWQTQTGAAFAVAAAIIGAAVVLHQTDSTRRMAEERRERRDEALRGVFALALSELSDYARACGQVLSNILEDQSRRPTLSMGGITGVPPPLVWPAGWQVPQLPDGLAQRLIELIEVNGSERSRKALIALAERTQVQHARIRSTSQHIQIGTPIVTRPHMIDLLLNAAELHASCDKLFPFARGQNAEASALISARDLRGSLLQIVSTPLRREVQDYFDEQHGPKAH
jgi:hypothetical protein